MTKRQRQSIEERYGPVVLEAVSKSDPGREPYRVRCLNGHYSCNCKGWIFSKDRLPNGDKQCTHTKRARVEGLQAPGIPIPSTGNIMTVPQATPQPELPLLDQLLACFPAALLRQVTTNIRAQMEAVLTARTVLKPASASTSASPPSRVRRIVFDD